MTAMAAMVVSKGQQKIQPKCTVLRCKQRATLRCGNPDCGAGVLYCSHLCRGKHEVLYHKWCCGPNYQVQREYAARLREASTDVMCNQSLMDDLRLAYLLEIASMVSGGRSSSLPLLVRVMVPASVDRKTPVPSWVIVSSNSSGLPLTEMEQKGIKESVIRGRMSVAIFLAEAAAAAAPKESWQYSLYSIPLDKTAS